MGNFHLNFYIGTHSVAPIPHFVRISVLTTQGVSSQDNNNDKFGNFNLHRSDKNQEWYPLINKIMK